MVADGVKKPDLRLVNIPLLINIFTALCSTNLFNLGQILHFRADIHMYDIRLIGSEMSPTSLYNFELGKRSSGGPPPNNNTNKDTTKINIALKIYCLIVPGSLIQSDLAAPHASFSLVY
jgi:hypothetical protein